MPQYKYTVLNKENQQLIGTIQSPDEASARKELNNLGFSILGISIIDLSKPSEENETIPENIVKFDFAAIDKTGKKVIGTIQGEEIFQVYKRLVNEYQFQVKALYPSDLTSDEKDKAQIKGIEHLQDLLNEEKMAVELAQKQQEIDQQEFEEKQLNLKTQIDFVLKKVNEILDTYHEELDPARKAKIKYYVEKLLRIKNSTNLDYIKQTSIELLTYLQKEEIFLNQEQKVKERAQLSIDTKNMMSKLEKITNPGQKDVLDIMRDWRKNNIINNPDPTIIDKTINLFISLFIGKTSEDPEISEARNKLNTTTSQLKEFITLYFKNADPDFKQEAKNAIKRLWIERSENKKNLALIIHQKEEEKLANIEFTQNEILEKEIFSLSGWVLTFYIIYYFLTIYLNSKEINLPTNTKLNLIFQTSIIKYFFTSLFLFVCLLGIKIEFFKRKKFANIFFIILFIISSAFIILNF